MSGTVPAATPVAMPEVAPTVAFDTSPLLHVPPDVASVKFIVLAAQTTPGPLIAAGDGFTTIETATKPCPHPATLTE